MIQIIGNCNGKKEKTQGILRSEINSPRSLDEYTVNVIDLSDKKIWENNESNTKTLNCSTDIKHLSEMINQRKKSKIVIILPQDLVMRFDYRYNGNRNEQMFNEKINLKNMLPNLSQIIKMLISEFYFGMSYEPTRTIIENNEIDASFHFSFINVSEPMTTSVQSEKCTTVETEEGIIVTTLNLITDADLLNFLNEIGVLSETTKIPEWANGIRILDDEKRIKEVIEKEKSIIQIQKEIEAAREIIEKNKKYKSILYENGKKLEEVVFDIMEQILGCDLSSFIDDKREDFLVKLEEFTLISEIKGVTSNIKNKHISQLENHYQCHLDDVEEQSEKDKVKAILIINHQRDLNITERQEINASQVALAERNESLIVETEKLLQLFGMFQNQDISKEQITDIFKTQIGLLKIQ